MTQLARLSKWVPTSSKNERISWKVLKSSKEWFPFSEFHWPDEKARRILGESEEAEEVLAHHDQAEEKASAGWLSP
jgi:hypothetical protein